MKAPRPVTAKKPVRVPSTVLESALRRAGGIIGPNEWPDDIAADARLREAEDRAAGKPSRRGNPYLV